jgi:transcriptional regulator with XRE-family HTH domain
MDDIRIGRILRLLRRRRGWTQSQLAEQVGLSQQAVSLIERGHSSMLAGGTLRRVFGALDARWEPVVSWRGGALDRLLDEEHSRLVAATASRLREWGWAIEIEVTYSSFGERGSIDVLAARNDLGAVLSVEVKSEITTVEATLRKIDEKDRLVRRLICRDRFRFKPTSVGRLLMLPATDTTRRRVRASAVVLDVALPARGATVRRWLAEPRGDLSGIWVVADTNGRGVTRTGGGSSRVRRAKATPNLAPPSSN